MAIFPAATCSLRSMNYCVVIELLVWLLICCVLIELLCGYWTNKKENQENERKMCLMFFSMRWHYTTTFRCVVVIFEFFPKRIKPMISWQPLLLYFFRFLVFPKNRPQKNDDDVLEWWKGQKKITGNKKPKSAKNTE